MLRATSVVTFVFAGALSLTGACGGKSAAEQKRSGTSAGSGGAGNNQAGSAGQGDGGSLVSAGSPGSGGTTGPTTGACSGPSASDSQGCNAAFAKWTHDDKTGLCLPIFYGGCGATQNNYPSLAECQAACSGGNPNYDACQQPSDCVVLPAGCCGGCDHPDFNAHELVAYHRDNLGKVDPCGDNDVSCEPCAYDPNGTSKFFVPTCLQGQCAVEDLRASELTACEVDADCRLRLGSQCCTACGEGTNLIAVHRDDRFEQHVCGDEPPGCPECEGTFPPGASAVCDTGRCTVQYALE